MTLNKTKGDMYDWITHTWNPIRGKCQFDCEYCSIKVIAKRYNQEQKPIHLEQKELSLNLGKDNKIFVGSSVDMFAYNVPSDWIELVLKHCNKYDNQYIFQTKNPRRFLEFVKLFPKNVLLGTTVETDDYERLSKISKATTPFNRCFYLNQLSDFKTFITIEPIIKFLSVNKFAQILKLANPSFINIGADSKNSGLVEPNREELLALIEEIKLFTKINKKSNLDRIIQPM